MKNTLILMTIILFASIVAFFIIDLNNPIIYFFLGTTGVSIGTILGTISKNLKNKKIKRKFVLYIFLIFVLTALISYFLFLYNHENSFIYIIGINVIGLIVAISMIFKGIKDN